MTSDIRLHFWERKLNDLMVSLNKSRRALADIQRVGPDAAPLEQRGVSKALASLREQERTVADIQQRITYIQQRVGKDAALLGRVGEALASVRESERTLADIRQRITSVRRDTPHTSPHGEKEDL